jgi:hypothetical protein
MGRARSDIVLGRAIAVNPTIGLRTVVFLYARSGPLDAIIERSLRCGQRCLVGDASLEVSLSESLATATFRLVCS